MTEDQVRHVARELWRRSGGSVDRPPPVDVEAAAQSLGLTIRRVVHAPTHALSHVEELSGALDFASGTVLVASWEASVRLRYTIAHEVGHEILGHERRLAQRADTDQLEQEADAFASELLMPEPLIARAVAEVGPAVPILAQQFGVSARAMERRLAAWLPPVKEVAWG